jgi:hypothetical protein
MRNFNNFRNMKNFFSSFRQDPRLQKILQNPITLLIGINTTFYVPLLHYSDSMET